LAIKWKRFKGQWTNYVKAAKVDKEGCQAKIFLACIRTDAYDVYINIEFAEETDRSDPAKLIEALERHCVGEINEVNERYHVTSLHCVRLAVLPHSQTAAVVFRQSTTQCTTGKYRLPDYQWFTDCRSCQTPMRVKPATYSSWVQSHPRVHICPNGCDLACLLIKIVEFGRLI